MGPINDRAPLEIGAIKGHLIACRNVIRFTQKMPGRKIRFVPKRGQELKEELRLAAMPYLVWRTEYLTF